jgi:hypothetical protein
MDIEDFAKLGVSALIAKANEVFDAAKAEGKPKKMPFNGDGWYDITPELSYQSLRCSSSNRAFKPDIKRYGIDMLNDDWKPTGQPIVFNSNGLVEGHNRLAAGYITDATFHSYIVTSAEGFTNDFAYYDIGRARSVTDALTTAGFGVLSKAYTAAVKGLLIRYELGRLDPYKQKSRMPAPNSRDAIAYMKSHPEFVDAAKIMNNDFSEAFKVINSEGVAIVFAYLVIRNHGQQELERFCKPLASGANLTEDDPVLGFRNTLFQWDPVLEDGKMGDPLRLALLCKAFNMWHMNQRLTRKRGQVVPLSIGEDEPFPRIEPAASPST